MQFKARGKLDDGTPFSIKLPGATNFMQAFSAVGKLLADKLGNRAGAVVSLRIATDEAEEVFTLRKPKKAKK